ncbi:PTPA-CTERM sorting domain-containing protein [Nodosilinea sp. LEGE 06152]|uniref:PTPA-CTERM sorting domain-containing protein n=1 Tax=Nodosilinea sp. LEGE 06152 TaxID=2777966 RepID=UPI00187F211E|nr:PTPA-CTERM sorting domain-containing protein [Nodosilinea sp. LEGE 06152]MBE9155744.1 PTPA-CTERM sorting domain-containing protein [Nodosilinea sp. LEGE 06152]
MQKHIFSKTSLGIAAAIAGAAMVIQAPSANAATFGPSPYVRASDSPFSGVNFSGGYFHLEDFEDGRLDTPGVTLTPGSANVLSPAPLTDSVDGDAGGLNGNGNDGHSLYSNGSNTLRFTFDTSVLGKLPTHVGIVWTDVGFVTSGLDGFGDVVFRAFGASNQLLAQITGTNLGDGLFGGQTAEDRFFGVKDLGGISYFEISMPNSIDWEVDHLQYGYQPIPTPALLPGLIGMGVAALRKRRTDEEQAS